MANIKKILAPVDFSETSRRAMVYGTLLAEQFNAPLDLLHVWDLPGYLRPDVKIQAEQGDATTLAAFARAQVDEAMAEFLAALENELLAAMEKHRLLDMRQLIEVGRPSDVILKIAAEESYDLIVMGTRGLTGMPHLMLGSVTERVLRLAPCPVLTVGPKDQKSR